MADDFVENWTTQTRKGLLDLGVMNAIRGRARYGYEIVKLLRGVPGLVIGEGTIYPILGRLEREGLAATSLEPSPEGPARKYYRLTPRGASVLADMNDRWDAIGEGIDAIRSEDHAGDD
jgi:PadR family transcriptional regulator PadR